MALVDEHCQKLPAGTPPLAMSAATALLPEIPGWDLRDNTLAREYRLADFREAFAFVNRVAVIAQAEDHHPDLCISFNLVRLTLTTHKIGGLSRNDFIMAAKINGLGEE